MLVRQQQRGAPLGRRHRQWREDGRGTTRRRGDGESEMAVIALVERLDEGVAREAERGCNLHVRHAWATRDVDRSALKMEAVGNATDFAIMRDRPEHARNPAERASDQRCPRRRARGVARTSGKQARRNTDVDRPGPGRDRNKQQHAKRYGVPTHVRRGASSAMPGKGRRVNCSGPCRSRRTAT